MYQRAANLYRNVDLDSAPKEQVVERLLERFVADCSAAKQAIARRDIPAKAAAIDHATRILVELQASLDHAAAPEMCAQLAALYMFATDRLNVANVSLAVPALDEAARVIGVLAEAFREARQR
jgi:flagellar secretion chaperone FliS